jgi:predicted glycosyltransferase involved in capsule biosynthesis
MDMYTLKKSILMIPTPGQTEQEYLAKYHHNKLHKLLKINQVKTFNDLPDPLPISILNKTAATKNFREVLKELF